MLSLAVFLPIVCGLLLLLLPSEALAIANYAIAALLLMMGVVCKMMKSCVKQ